jgi:hypothetical protein
MSQLVRWVNAHWFLLMAAVAGAVSNAVCVHMLSRNPLSTPGWGTTALSYLPYLAAATVASRSHRLAGAIVAVPVIADINCVLVLSVGEPTWLSELLWRALKLTTCFIAVPLAVGVGLWLERQPPEES